MSHVAYEWVMSQVWTSRTWRMNESKLQLVDYITSEWVMSHMLQSSHVWMSHIKCELVMSHINESYHMWTSHVTHQWVISHVNESCHTSMSHITHQQVTSRLNEARHVTYKRVQLAASPLAHHNLKICDDGWKMSAHERVCHTWRSRATYERGLSHMNECTFLPPHAWRFATIWGGYE